MNKSSWGVGTSQPNMASLSSFGFPITRAEAPGVVAGREGVWGAGMSVLRPELSRAPANAQYSGRNLVTSTHTLASMPDSVSPPEGLVKPDASGLYAHRESETMLTVFAPVFLDKDAHRSQDDLSHAALVSLSAVNFKLAQLSEHLVDNASLMTLFDVARDRYQYLGPLLAKETGNFYENGVCTVGRFGRSFVSDIFRNCYTTFTSDLVKRSRVAPNVGARHVTIPYNPYIQGNQLGLLLTLVPRSWVTDPAASQRSLVDIMQNMDAVDYSDMCVQYVPYAAYGTKEPTSMDLFGVPGPIQLVHFVKIGTVAPTHLDSESRGNVVAGGGASVGSGGVGATHGAIFPGPRPSLARVPVSDPISVYLDL